MTLHVPFFVETVLLSGVRHCMLMLLFVVKLVIFPKPRPPEPVRENRAWLTPRVPSS